MRVSVDVSAGLRSKWGGEGGSHLSRQVQVRRRGVSKRVGQERRASGGRGIQLVDLPGVVMAQAAERRALASNLRPKLEGEERERRQCRDITLLLALPCGNGSELCRQTSH